MSNTRLSCPKCGDGHDLAVIETAQVLTLLSAAGSDELSYLGETELLEETMSPIGILCRCCGWTYLGANWRDQMAKINTPKETIS